MNSTCKIIKYQISDAIRSKWLFLYTLLLCLITYALFRFSGESARVLLSLTNLTLIIVPLVSILFGALHLYSSQEFLELLLSQPVSRSTIFRGVYWGIALPLAGSYLIGVGLPLMLYGGAGSNNLAGIVLIAIGVILTLLFTSVAFVIAMWTDDRAKGLGIAIIFWLLVSVIYDGTILFLVFTFQDYPLERSLVFASFANPVDLARIVMLLQLDISALMGYTGAVFERSFGSYTGYIVSLISFLLWQSAAYFLSLFLFKRKDF